MKTFRSLFILALVAAGPVWGQREFFELSPLNYSKTESKDALAVLAKDWGDRSKLGNEPLEVLEAVLKALDVPVESQGLLFSKTSKQNDLITPRNPRAMYFGDNAYVGYVPGGSIEVAAMDPVLGPVFYLLSLHGSGTDEWIARDNSCLQCHGTSRTELVPGLLVRSVYADADGQPLLAAGSFVTDHASPFKERWGGWYVTGMHGEERHMGNVTGVEDENGDVDLDVEAGANVESLKGKFATHKYLKPTSDIVSLMVLEHQCTMHNLLTKAGMEYRRLSYLQRAIDKDADLAAVDGMAMKVAADSADEILRYMLFCDELDLGDGVEGGEAFQEMFEAKGPETADGDSLRELRLYGRLFKTRCSYMIHSPSFDHLPDPVRNRVLTRLWGVVVEKDESGEFDHLGGSEKRRIKKIVLETVKRLPGCWKE